MQAQAEHELGPESPELVGADEEPSEDGPSADDSGPSDGDEGPPDVGDVELVVRTAVVGIGIAVGATWTDVGARLVRAAPAGAARFARHFGPRLGHRGLWAGLAVLCSFLDPQGPRASQAIVEVSE